MLNNGEIIFYYQICKLKEIQCRWLNLFMKHKKSSKEGESFKWVGNLIP